VCVCVACVVHAFVCMYCVFVFECCVMRAYMCLCMRECVRRVCQLGLCACLCICVFYLYICVCVCVGREGRRAVRVLRVETDAD
jgi:hypothetical protein